MTPDFRVFDRDALIQQYREALEERAKIQTSNQQLQNKLSEYFKKKKTEERGGEMEKNANDQEQRYMKYMSELEEQQKKESSKVKISKPIFLFRSFNAWGKSLLRKLWISLCGIYG